MKHLSLRLITIVGFLLIIVTGILTPIFLTANAHTGPNSGPTAGADFITVHRSRSQDNVILLNDSDPDGDTISITTTGWFTTAHGQLFLNSSGGYIYNPTFGYVGTDSFTYTLCDQHNACTTGGIAFNVVNAAPVTNGETFNVHRSLSKDNALLPNDSDPDGDPITITPTGWTTGAHGQFFVNGSGGFVYNPTFGYTGLDTYTYTVCDNWAACTNATVTFNVVNTAPVTNDETFTVHRNLSKDNALLLNDSDPDGDPITISPTGSTTGAHGQFFVNGSGGFVYNPTFGYVGPDSYTYRVCDNWAGCTNATVNFNVVNQLPVTFPKFFVARGQISQDAGPNKGLMFGNFDPDGDPITMSTGSQTGAHGTLFTTSSGGFVYTPTPNFTGSDIYNVPVCDNWAGCTNQVVIFFAIAGDDDNLGCEVSMGGPRKVGEPVDVTNGNMYLEQSDYEVPGAGHNIHLQRSYNSKLKRTGLFGVGWTSAYDESLQVYDGNMIRLNEPDGRATYFTRPAGSTGAFTPIVGDFHGQITATAGGYSLTMKDGSAHQFDSTGRLLALVDRNGNQTTLQYNLSGTLSSVTDPFGRVLSFLVFNNRVTAIADTTGIVAEYTYTSDRLMTVTYADGSGYTFAYQVGSDNHPRLSSVKDKLNNILEAHAYDSSGRATTSEKQGGVELYTFSYFSATETRVTDALGRVTKYFFDKSKGRNVVTSIEGVCGCGSGGSQVRTWTYDNNLNVTQITDGLAHATNYTYDSAGNVLTSTDATGTITSTYNSFGQVLTRTDQMSGVTTNTYSSTGNLLTTKDPLNNTTTFTYDSRGQLLTVTDARNKVTTFTWDSTGRPTQKQDALNNTTTFAYDLRARLTSATNALSHTTSYEYDAAGRLKKIIYPDTKFAEFTYDLAGRRTKVKNPRGNETTLAYDGAYRLTSVTDALNHATTYGYDLMSNRTSMTDALGRVTNYEYDGFNRLKKIIYPPAISGGTRLEQSATYDAEGNVTKTTDTAGRDTTYAYDSANRLTQVTDPALQVTQYQYNARSQRTAVIDALSQQYSFVYDPLGRVTQLTRGGTSMSYTYDAVGNLTQRTDHNNAVTTYVYDDINRLTTINYPDSTTASYGYNAVSRPTSATNQNGTVTFAYDSRKRLTSTTDVWGQTVGYSYDENGNRTAITLGGSPYLTYQYDVVDRLTTLSDSLSQNFTYNYDVADRVTSRVAPNGVTTSFTYDGMDRLFELSHTKAPATLGIHQYGYNTANNLTSWLGSSGNRSFNYDSADRLISVLKMGGNESYGYDAVGNRTASHLSTSYTYQPFNKLATTASATYTYDNNGALLTQVDGSGTRTLTWDPENRLKQVSLPGGLEANYKYDALGRRIQRTTSTGADERYVYDGQSVVADLDSSSVVTTSYVNGLATDDHLRQTNTTAGVSYFLTDHLGTTAALTDSTGNVVETLSYDSFGNNAGSTRTRYTFTGRERDADTGLLHYRARSYDPQLGRFISEDPIGFAGGANWYAYVGNNPARFTDPSGLDDADRIWEESRKPKPPDPNPWYWSHNESADNDVIERDRPSAPWPFWPPNTVVGDGAIFSGPTITEFFSGVERSKQACKPFGERWLNAMGDTNGVFPGAGAPLGTTLITGPGATSITGIPGPISYVYNRGALSALPGVAGQGLLVGAATHASFEGGIATGSFITAAGCPCGYRSPGSGRFWRFITLDW